MKILYVTMYWSSLENVLTKGEERIKGMPSFFYPLEFFIKNGAVVDLAVLGKNIEKFNIKLKWLWNSRIYSLAFESQGSFTSRLISFLINFFRIYRIVNKNQYDFIYGQGPVGAIGNLVALFKKIPFGGRLYGTFRYRDIQLKRSKWYIARKHPLEYLMYVLPKKFLIITNDGTKGDKVQKKIGSNRYKFYYLINGVDKTKIGHGSGDEVCVSKPGEEFFIYPARIARWKCQDRAIRAIAKLEPEYRRKIIFYGAKYDEEYYHELCDLVRKSNLEDYVVFSEPISRKELLKQYKLATAFLSLCDHSNFGNVMIEALSSGGCVITLNDEMLKDIIVNNESGILLNDLEELPDKLRAIVSDKHLETKIKKKAMQRSKEIFISWEKRAGIEFDIIHHAVNQEK